MTERGASRLGPLATVALLAAARWLAMRSAEPYRAVLPGEWLRGEAMGLTRLAANATLCAVWLVLVPAVLWARSTTLSGARPISGTWGLGAPRLGPRGWLIFAAGAAIALGAGVAAGGHVEALQRAFPVYRGAARGIGPLLLAETLSISVLVATEVFYRGFALAALAPGFGRWAAALSSAIYALDHVGGSWPELVGSPLAGLALCALSLRTASVWPGFILHASIAVGVDLGSIAALE